MWEVEEQRAGHLLAVVDLLTGARREVREVRGAKALTRRSVGLGRVVELKGEGAFMGMHPHALGPGQAYAVVKAMQERRGAERFQPAELRGGAHAWALLELWRKQAVVPEGEPENTDGERLVFCTDVYELAKPAKEVLRRLGALEGAHDEGDEVTFTRRGNAVNPTWWATVVGTATVKKGKLGVEANSEARADSLRRRVEGALGSAVRFVERKRQAMTSGAVPAGGVKVDAQALPMDPRSGVAWAAMDGARAWLRQPLGQLGGLTPLEAAKEARLREAVHVELKTWEWQAGRGEPVNAAALRREVGLDARGEWVGPDDAWVAEGRGEKMSQTFMDFVAPLLGEVEPGAKGWKTLARVGAEAWNGALLGHEGELAALAEHEQEWGRFLMRRYRQVFAGDERFIGSAELVEEHGRAGVRVMFRPLHQLAGATAPKRKKRRAKRKDHP